MTELERNLEDRADFVRAVGRALLEHDAYAPVIGYEYSIHENGYWFDEWVLVDGERAFCCNKDSLAEILRALGKWMVE